MRKQAFAIAHAACVLSLFVVNSSARADANWPQFRGAEGSGVVESATLPDTWSAEPAKNIAWKTDIPGRGWSSPIVWGNRVFVTTAVNPQLVDLPKKGLYFGGEQKVVPDAVHQWKVLCLDADSGKILWEKQVHEGKPGMTIHSKNSYASETPVTDGEHVYAYFGNLGIWCLDFEGNIVWKHEMPSKRVRFGWGTASSPVLHEGRLYIVSDNEEESYLLALDKKTGDEVWRVPREERSNWSTPFVWKYDKRTEIVTLGTGRVISYDLDGKELWSLKGMSSITIAMPYTANGLLYISSGYVGDKKRPLMAIRPGAKGDISLADGATSNEFIAWAQPVGAPYNPSTLVSGERMYVLFDRGFLSCSNAKDGTLVYEREQIPEGKNFTSSPWAYGDKVFCLNEDGVTFVFKAGDQFELLHQNKLAADDMGMATPAIAGDKLFLRTSARMYCIKNGAGG